MFRVIVASHAHYMDPSEHYVLGDITTKEEAVEVCERVVHASINDVGVGFYTTMGDDPFIVATDGSVAQLAFSA